jgi:hypothetical protein
MAADWLRRAWPRLPEFLAARAELDPDELFLSEYYRTRLGIEPRRVRPAVANQPKTAPAHEVVVTWPLLFDLEPVGEEFAARATRQYVFKAQGYTDPERLFDAFITMQDGSAWMEQFRCVTRAGDDPEAVFDEHFSFMRLRIRTLRSERPNCWVARVEAASLPLATRLIERIDIVRALNGESHITWTFDFDPHPLALPIEAQLRPIFEGMFRRSLQALVTWSERSMGIARSTCTA